MTRDEIEAWGLAGPSPRICIACNPHLRYIRPEDYRPSRPRRDKHIDDDDPMMHDVWRAYEDALSMLD